MQRLDKILSDAGVASRKELKNMIRTGRVTVNGKPARASYEGSFPGVAGLRVNRAFFHGYGVG